MNENRRGKERSRPSSELGTLLGVFERPSSLAAERAFLGAVGRLRDGPPERREALARQVTEAALLWALEVAAGMGDPRRDGTTGSSG